MKNKEKDKRNQKRYILIGVLIVIIVMLGLPLALNSFLGMRNLLTGAATSDTATLAVTISNAPTINFVTFYNATPPQITEASSLLLEFSFTANDTDGLQYVDNTSAAIIVNRTGGSRYNYSCTAAGTVGASPATYINFSCSVYLWYWEPAGDWTINVSVKDLGGAYSQNSSTSFLLAQTTAMAMTPSALTWSTLSLGATNQTSNNDPLVINNTGNKNIAKGGITVTAYDLQGLTTTTDFIRAKNFTAFTQNGTSSCTGAGCLECNGTIMTNATAQTLPIANITAGNNSINDW
ncbi:MAG: hypothetical protein AAB221_04765, partial [Bacteroidota bacterium]